MTRAARVSATGVANADHGECDEQIITEKRRTDLSDTGDEDSLLGGGVGANSVVTFLNKGGPRPSRVAASFAKAVAPARCPQLQRAGTAERPLGDHSVQTAHHWDAIYAGPLRRVRVVSAQFSAPLCCGAAGIQT